MKALLLEDDAGARSALDCWIQGRGFTTRLAGSLSEARTGLQEGPFDLALLDVQLPDGNGLDLVEHIPESTDVVIMTGYGDTDLAVRSLRAGVRDFLRKPIDLEQLERTLTTSRRENCSRPSAQAEPGLFVGESPAMRDLRSLLARVAPTNATVLLTGETGVGKELAASYVHELSQRKTGPFEAVNCGALSASLIESELFGHERGSFTGASKQHKGIFERARGGTLFLDEVTEMPPELQVKLLRVLELQEVTRVGGSSAHPVDVRVISASNRDLFEAVDQGGFREDLLHRLYVFPVTIPPLRERGEDITLLARTFVEQWATENSSPKTLNSAALDLLREHSWPGNVRELRNCMLRACILSGETIGAEHVQYTGSHLTRPFEMRLGMSLKTVERRLLLGTLEQCGGDKKLAAKSLGVSLKTVYNKLHSYEGTDRPGPH